MANRCLLLYGSSIFLAGILAALEDGMTPDIGAPLQMIAVEAGRTDAAALIRVCQPLAVLFDLVEGLPDFVPAAMREQPDLLLIGVDPSYDEALVLSVMPQQALSVADLLHLIHHKDSKMEPLKDGNHE